MTASEFNIKYNDYLEKGHYGLDIDVPSVVEYLDKVFQDLIHIPGFKYSQIKTKFNSVRFYSTLKSGLDSALESHIQNILNFYSKQAK